MRFWHVGALGLLVTVGCQQADNTIPPPVGTGESASAVDSGQDELTQVNFDVTGMT